MKKLIILIAALLLLIGAVTASEAECSATIQYHFGPYCINPVVSNLPGFYPIGSYVEFYRADNSTDIGRVTGYTWNLGRQAYDYHLATGPFYRLVPNGISAVNEAVLPGFIFASSQAVVGG